MQSEKLNALKFNLDQVVEFEGVKVVVWDYSARYKEYVVKFENGKLMRGIKESQLSE